MSDPTWDVSELTDQEIAQIGQVIKTLQDRFSKKRATAFVLEEFEKVANQMFHEIGLTIKMSTAEALLSVGPPKIDITGRVPGHESEKYGFDHERKMYEVKKAVDDGSDARIRSISRRISH